MEQGENMKIYKKLIALLLAGMVALSGPYAAATNEKPSAAGTETSIIDVPEKSETSIVDAPEKTDTSVVDDVFPDKGTDLKDTEYTKIDITGYTQWDGKTEMKSGENYFIYGEVKINKNVTIPENTTLVLTANSKMTVYKDKILRVKGHLVSEPKSTISLSCKAYFYKGALFECYGDLKATVSSVIHYQGEFILRSDATAVYSGAVNVHKEGIYLNYGKTNLTKSSKMLVTGDFQTPEKGRFINKGYFGVTISGRASFSGSYHLYGQSVNSGVFIFEKTVKYYKAKSATFAVSKSSRLIDYRYYKPVTSNNTDTGKKGIDVSYAQGSIDWLQVKMSGVDFAMIRASRGYISEAKPMAQDVTFEYNITEATKYGLRVGVYHYLYADTVEEAIEEARFLIKTIEPYRITYPVVLDVEEQYQADLGVDKITEICEAFLKEIENAGYYPMIYANKSWLTNYLDMERLGKYEVWLAQWHTVPTYLGEFGMWQYSAKGIVSGIDGYVDLNLSYKDYAKIIREGEYNNL